MNLKWIWHRHRFAFVSIVAVFFVGSVFGWLVLGYGGPEAQDEVWRPVVESWSLVAEESGGRVVLCDQTEPCNATTGQGVENCVWTARIALSGHDNPFFLHDTKALLFVVIEEDNEGSTLELQHGLGGPWWRALGKDVNLLIPIPCNAVRLSVAFNIEGMTLWGGDFEGAEALEQRLWR